MSEKSSVSQSQIVEIVIDTREQIPLAFSDRVRVATATLRAGDYSVKGYESEIAVERKTLNDFVNTIILQRERFREELKKLQSYKAACVVVEADASAIHDHRYSSNAHPNAVWGAMMSIIIDYSIPIYFLSNRHTAIKFTEDYLVRYAAMAARQSSLVVTAERKAAARERVNALLPAELRLPVTESRDK